MEHDYFVGQINDEGANEYSSDVVHAGVRPLAGMRPITDERPMVSHPPGSRITQSCANCGGQPQTETAG